jgi:hypothetical protein
MPGGPVLLWDEVKYHGHPIPGYFPKPGHLLSCLCPRPPHLLINSLHNLSANNAFTLVRGEGPPSLTPRDGTHAQHS